MKKIFFIIALGVVLFLTGCGKSVEIKFDSNGGSEIATIVKAGDFDPNNLPEPDKAGYEFIGWYLDSSMATPIIGNVPKNLKFTLYAKWKALNQTVKLEHYLEDLDGSYHLEKTDNLTHATGEVVNASVGSFTGYEQNKNHSSSVLSLTVSANSNNLLKVYYDRKIVKIIIDENGADAVSDLASKYGSEVTPPTLKRIGYEFDGWDQEFPTTMPTSDITITAKWKALEVNYKVEYFLENANDNDYTLIESIDKLEYSDTLVTAEAKSYTGFTEFPNHPNYLSSAKVLGDASLVLKVYFNRNCYQISYLSNGGSEVNSLNVKHGANITAPVSTRIGYEFNHWYQTNEAEAYTFDTMPLFDLTLTAKWTKIIYMITFETNADISVVSITATYEDVIQAPTPPIRAGYRFLDWYEDQNLKIPYVFTTMPAKNFTLYAKWEGLPYTMEFDTAGGDAINPITAEAGAIIEKPIPIHLGFDFINWYKESLCINEYTDWTMPVGGIKLYAKWAPKDYTLTFETNGGTLVAPITAPYHSQITEPAWPTKEGYFFDGWYLDADCTITFEFINMPLGGGTIYVKWTDVINQNQISNVLRQETFSEVGVKGTVFAKNNNDYFGFYLLDHTGFIYIAADHNLVNLGDLVYLEGYLNPYALIDGVSNLEIISSNNQITDPSAVNYDNLFDYHYLIKNQFKYLQITGIIINEDGFYYLLNPLTSQMVKLDHRFYQEETISDYINQYVVIDFVLIYDYREVRLGVVTIDNSINTTETKMMIIQGLLNQLNMTYVLSEDPFDLSKLNLYGWAELTFSATGENASLYDAVNQCFLPTDTAKIVDFLVEIKINDEVESVTLSIEVGPVFRIVDVLTLPLGIYHLQGIVVMKLHYDGIIVLKDSSGTLLIDIGDSRNIGVGDELAITVEKYSLDNNFMDYQVISQQVLQTNQELNNPPHVLSAEEVRDLSQSLNFMDGEYVEVRGFAGLDDYDYHSDFFIKIGDYKYPILIGAYSAYENFYKYLDYEVQLRAYLMKLEDQMYFLLMDTRGDIQIPSYSDQELVNLLQEVFTRTYAGKVFHPYEIFEFHNDPFYPATISWEMDSEAAKYFDFERNMFLSVDQVVDVNIDITITMGVATLNFRYHTTLEPYETLNASEFKYHEGYQPVFVEGIVVYRHPRYLYLQADDGLIMVYITDLDVYVGDHVVLYGMKQYVNYNDGKPYLAVDYESNLPTIIKVISRDNSFTLEPEAMTMDEIYQLDGFDVNSYTRYIEVTGALIKKGNQYYLSAGNKNLLIDYVDEYTMYNQLNPYLYTETTLRGFISDWRVYEGLWSIQFLGCNGDIESRPFSDLEKVNLIKDQYYNAYNDFDYPYNYIIFANSHPNYGGQIVYESFGDNASVFNFSTGTVEQVFEITPVDIRATITVGEVTDTFTFVVNVLPKASSIPIITIGEALNANPGDLVTIKASVIGMQVGYPDSYLLLQDDTGDIYVRTGFYFFNYNTVGRIMQFTGTIEIVRGRKQITNDKGYQGYSYVSINQEFIPTSYSELLNYDNYDQSNYGKPLLLTGEVILENYSNFYLTNGYDRIRLLAFESNSELLRKYIGYRVQVKGFYFGYSNTTDNEISVVVAKHDSYLSTVALDYNAYSSEELANLIEEHILSLYPINELWEFEQLPLSISHPYFTCAITYSIARGSEYATIIDNMLIFNDITESQEIVLEITIVVDDLEKTFTKEIKVNALVLHTLDDLFAANPGTFDIRLPANVIYISEDFVYFLINGKIYYLEGYYSYDLMVNSEVWIIGKKTIIDGVADYSYQIEFIFIQENMMYELVAEPISIKDIYDNDFSINNLSEKYLEVYGILHYDIYSEMFYLEDNGNRIYIRSTREMYDYKVSMNYYDELFYLVGEKVYLKLLFPNKYIYGDYYLLDFMNNGDDINFPEITIEENLDCAINHLNDYFSSRTYYSGDYFNLYQKNYYHGVSYLYTLENPMDTEFIDLERNYLLIVEEVKVVRFNVLVTDAEENYRETTIEITINPLPVSTIRDVLWGESYQIYLIEGIVQGFHDNQFIILKDASGLIYINANYYCMDYANLNVGDQLQVLGYKDYYGHNNMVPIFSVDAQVKVISSGNEVNKVALEMNFLDIIAIDYLNPDSYIKYIEISGRVVFTGNTSYPAYAILDETSGTTYKLEMIGQTYKEFNGMMNTYLDQSITVTGWLIGMQYYYSAFSWELVYDSHIVNN